MRGKAAFTTIILVLVLAWPQAQGTPPPTPLTLVSRDGRRPIPTTILSGQELIALDDVATLFQVAVREDALAGGITLTYRGRSIVARVGGPTLSNRAVTRGTRTSPRRTSRDARRSSMRWS